MNTADFLEDMLCKEILAEFCWINNSISVPERLSNSQLALLTSKDSIKRITNLSNKLKEFDDDEPMIGKLSYDNSGTPMFALNSGGHFEYYTFWNSYGNNFIMFKHVFEFQGSLMKFGPMFQTVGDFYDFFFKPSIYNSSVEEDKEKWKKIADTASYESFIEYARYQMQNRAESRFHLFLLFESLAMQKVLEARKLKLEQLARDKEAEAQRLADLETARIEALFELEKLKRFGPEKPQSLEIPSEPVRVSRDFNEITETPLEIPKKSVRKLMRDLSKSESRRPRIKISSKSAAHFKDALILVMLVIIVSMIMTQKTSNQLQIDH